MENQAITIRELYPNLSEAEQRIAEENLVSYLAVVLRIYQRLEQDEEAMEEFRILTAEKNFARIPAKVDSLSNPNYI